MQDTLGDGFSWYNGIRSDGNVMEDIMAATISRTEAREKLIKTVLDALDRIIPADECMPLKGTTFANWEDQATEFRRTVLPTLLEVRAALEPNATVDKPGHCPFCGSDSIYMKKETTRPEVLTPDGPVIIEKQHCRCRSCDGTFSPSES